MQMLPGDGLTGAGDATGLAMYGDGIGVDPDGIGGEVVGDVPEGHLSQVTAQ